MNLSPFLMSETEKERILSLHSKITEDLTVSPTGDTINYSIGEKCVECLTKAIPKEAEDITNDVIKTIDDYMAKGKTPTLDTIKDILWDLNKLKNPLTILSTGKDLYKCIKGGYCKSLSI